jgi:hypothetical protein
MLRRGHYLSTWAIQLEADTASSVTQIIPGMSCTISEAILCKRPGATVSNDQC